MGVDQDKVVIDPERAISARRHRALPAGREVLAPAHDRDARQGDALLARHPLEEAAGEGPRGDPPRQRRDRAHLRVQGQEVELPVGGELRGAGADARAALQGDRLPARARRDREVHVGQDLPELRRAAPQARGARDHGGRPLDRRTLGARGRRPARRDGRARAGRPRADDRRQGPPGDRRPAPLPRRRRRRLPHARPLLGDALGRREPAHPARHPDRLEADGRALRARRALDRAAPAGQRAADPHPDRDARPRQLGAGGRARRGHHPRRRLGDRPRARRRGPRRRAGGRGHSRADHRPPRVADRQVPARRALRAAAADAAQGPGGAADRGRRAPQQPPGPDRPLPAGRLHGGHRRLRLGQVEPGQRRPAQGARPPLLPALATARASTSGSTGSSTSTR